MSMTTELAQRMKAAALNAMGAYERLSVMPDGDLFDISLAEGTQLDADITALNSFHDEATPANVLALVEALEARDKQIADSENRVGKQNRHICELFDDNTALRQRIIELEEKLETADKLHDSAFRHGLQHGFSLGQTDNQAGFEQCMTAYSQKEKNNG